MKMHLVYFQITNMSQMSENNFFFRMSYFKGVRQILVQIIFQKRQTFNFFFLHSNIYISHLASTGFMMRANRNVSLEINCISSPYASLFVYLHLTFNKQQNSVVHVPTLRNYRSCDGPSFHAKCYSQMASLFCFVFFFVIQHR